MHWVKNGLKKKKSLFSPDSPAHRAQRVRGHLGGGWDPRGSAWALPGLPALLSTAETWSFCPQAGWEDGEAGWNYLHRVKKVSGEAASWAINNPTPGLLIQLSPGRGSRDLLCAVVVPS